ncbi:hypothetical protein Rhal01_02622 [Rubritalea halochordaticola]|uniref:SAM-dependent methyltransferase n=1 Tax=Rubritalea halochordaticola TaxID=714537 RepID=A0ABP9V1Q2_9BACT
MPVKLENVVPFGRTLEEYRRMLSLPEDLSGLRILGCGDGPASFNAEASRCGAEVISIDPLYQFSGEQILERFEASVPLVMDQVRASVERWNWSFHGGPDGLLRQRRKAIEGFLADYSQGKQEGRYLEASLPALDFEDGSFDLCLCSHFLFLYTEAFDEVFHLASLLEMLRLSSEVRVFPLLDLQHQRSRHLEPVMEALREAGYECAVEQVDYELQIGGNEMLRIWHATR